MPKKSAGLLLFRIRSGRLEVLLVHLGGPFWSNKENGAWFVPKGEILPGEDELAAGEREFKEETGFDPHGPFVPLGSVKPKSGKTVVAWAFEGDCDPSQQQFLSDGVAPALRQAAGIPRGRSRRLLHAGPSPRKNSPRRGFLSHPPRRAV